MCAKDVVRDVGSVALLTSVDVDFDLSPGAKYDDIATPSGSELNRLHPEISEDKKIRELLEQLDRVQRYTAYALQQGQTGGMPKIPVVNAGMEQFSA